MAGDFNHAFDNGVGRQAAIMWTTNKKVHSPQVLPSSILGGKKARPQNAIKQMYKKPGDIRLNSTLSDHDIMWTSIPLFSKESGSKPYDLLHMVVWNVNSKLHNILDSRIAETLRQKKLETISIIMSKPEVSIVVLTEWGNVKFERNSKSDVPTQYAEQYGHIAMQKKGIPVVTIRQFLGKQPITNRITPARAEWVMFNGNAGKVTLVRTSILLRDAKGKPMLSTPHDLNGPLVGPVSRSLNTAHRNSNSSDIMAKWVELPVDEHNTVYICAVHDTALGAYEGKYYKPNRWNERIDNISAIFTG